MEIDDTPALKSPASSDVKMHVFIPDYTKPFSNIEVLFKEYQKSNIIFVELKRKVSQGFVMS